MVDPYVYAYLLSLREISSTIVFVSTSALGAGDTTKLEGICTRVVLRENAGYDFMSYRVGLDCLTVSEYDEIVLCNDSVYGPIFSLADIFTAMEGKKCDFWGMTESHDGRYHIQSYFLVFRKAAVASAAFKRYWRDVDIVDNKKDLIMAYEIGLTRRLTAGGLRPGCYVHLPVGYMTLIHKFYDSISLGNIWLITKRLLGLVRRFVRHQRASCNITHWFWKEMITDSQMPFIKIELLRNNPERVLNVKDVASVVAANSRYRVRLIEGHLDRMRAPDHNSA